MSDEMDYPWCHTCCDSFPMRKFTYSRYEETGRTFYCPRGHLLVITQKSVVIQMRTSRSMVLGLKRREAWLERCNDSLRGVQTRFRNRLLNGCCPYCRKRPQDMVAHIQSQHKPKAKRC